MTLKRLLNITYPRLFFSDTIYAFMVVYQNKAASSLKGVWPRCT